MADTNINVTISDGVTPVNVRLIGAGPSGPIGPTGAPAFVVSTAVTYQASASGTDIPSGAWSEIVPAVPQGEYLWTRTETIWNDGTTGYGYSVARQGMDGLGTVSSVNHVSPDSSGDIALTPSAIGAAGNPNLLDNPWFTINQRDVTYDTRSGYYCADRWKYVAAGTPNTGSWSLGPDGITLTKDGANYVEVRQAFPADFKTELSGKIVTVSVMFGDGSVSSVTGAFGSISRDLGGIWVYINSGTAGDIFIRRSEPGSKTVRAVKLELGSVSTLANDHAPDYVTELLKCQRYFVRFSASSNLQFLVGGSNGGLFYAPMQLPTEMAYAPSVRYQNVDIYPYQSGGSVGIAELRVEVHEKNNKSVSLQASFASAVMDAKQMGVLRIRAGGYIDFVADL